MRKNARLTAILVAALLVVPASGSAQEGPSRGQEARSGQPPERGQYYEGYRRNPSGSCGPGYEFRTQHGPDHGPDCTHGPDPAPAAAGSDGTPGDPATIYSGTGKAGQVRCEGDGVSGNRVQAIYVAVGRIHRWYGFVGTDRYSSLKSSFPKWAAGADGQFYQSALKTGAGRHVRFVTSSGGSGCTLSVAKTTVSPSIAGNALDVIGALRSQGFNRSDRKYLAWVDYQHDKSCGQANVKNDDSRYSSNQNNSGNMFAVVWCFNWSEGHELMHTMGGVQLSAPNSSGGYHCTDEHDRMCYKDGPNVVLSYLCPTSQGGLFDCNNDDYFHTSPPAGSYLATHWNPANNRFLIRTTVSCTWETFWYNGKPYRYRICTES